MIEKTVPRTAMIPYARSPAMGRSQRQRAARALYQPATRYAPRTIAPVELSPVSIAPATRPAANAPQNCGRSAAMRLSPAWTPPIPNSLLIDFPCAVYAFSV